MPKIDSIQIERLWGKKNISLSLNTSINFIIGINGTGKTTIMALLGAALTRNYEKLFQFNFKKIIITINGSKKKPVICIIKDSEEDRPGDEMSYQISESITDFKRGRFSEYLVARAVFRKLGRNVRHRIYFEDDEALRNKLESLLQIVWLTVHRSDTSDLNIIEQDEYRQRISNTTPLIDLKLNSILYRLTRYFSALKNEEREVFSEYRKKVIWNMFSSSKPLHMVFGLKSFDDKLIDKIFNLEDAVFAEVGINRSEYAPFLEKLVVDYKNVKTAYDKKNTISLPELNTLLQVYNLVELSSQWQESNKKRKVIFKRRDLFISKLNKMYYGKELDINKSNELIVISEDGKVLSVDSLSSGEKQLLILLAEALLQDEVDWLYLADEPELSLHIAWQAELVDTIRQLNSGVQILFSTHSPDIVSSYGECIFNMEELLG